METAARTSEICLGRGDYELVQDTIDAFGRQKTMSFTALAGKLGRTVKVRHLIALGVLVVTDSGISLTDTPITQWRPPVELDVDSIKEDDEAGWDEDDKPQTRVEEPVIDEADLVRQRAASLNARQQRLLRFALSATNWRNMRIPSSLIEQAGYSKVELAQLLIDLGYPPNIPNVAGKQMFFHFPRSIRDIKDEFMGQ